MVVIEAMLEKYVTSYLVNSAASFAVFGDMDSRTGAAIRPICTDDQLSQLHTSGRACSK